jgi:hypothetical protein
MFFFSNKPKVDFQEFCRGFYESAIFPKAVGQTDMHSTFCETVRKNLGDQAFMGIQPSLFESELRALRLEVFGIAWLHHVDERLAASQSAFTQSFLREINAADLWEALGEYNQATARSASSKLSNSARANLDLKRVEFFDVWTAHGVDSDAVARAANRLGSAKSWKENLTHVTLSFTLTKRLGIEINDEARGNVLALIQGFYNGAKEEIKKVRISG